MRQNEKCYIFFYGEMKKSYKKLMFSCISNVNFQSKNKITQVILKRSIGLSETKEQLVY